MNALRRQERCCRQAFRGWETIAAATGIKVVGFKTPTGPLWIRGSSAIPVEPSFTHNKPQIIQSASVNAAVAKASPSTSTSSKSKTEENPNKPNQDQLQKVHDVLANSITKLFTQPMDYSIYNPEILFINNIRNKTTQGLLKYIQQVAYLRTIGHLRFAYVRFEILNTHVSPEEGRITIRWRINGISGLRVMLKFWKFRLWNWKEIMTQQEGWFDGISYFDVAGDGLVYRHIADKVMEDKSRQINEVKSTNAPLAAKLALLATLFPQPSLSFSTTDAGSVLNATSTIGISNNNFGHDK